MTSLVFALMGKLTSQTREKIHLTYTSVWRATPPVMGKTMPLVVVSVVTVTIIIIATVIPIPRSLKQRWFLGHNVYYSVVITLNHKTNIKAKIYS